MGGGEVEPQGLNSLFRGKTFIEAPKALRHPKGYALSEVRRL